MSRTEGRVRMVMFGRAWRIISACCLARSATACPVTLGQSLVCVVCSTICKAWEAHADRGLMDGRDLKDISECSELAGLASVAVDFAKSGGRPEGGTIV